MAIYGPLVGRGGGHNVPLRPPWLDAGSGLHSALVLTRGGKSCLRALGAAGL